MPVTAERAWARRGLPMWLRLLVLGCIGVSVTVDMFGIMFGHRGFARTSIVGGTVGGAVASWLQFVQHREVGKISRRKLAAVMRSGEPSGDDRVDRIALRRLADLARLERDERIFRIVLALVLLLLPFVAAWRAQDRRYLFTLAPGFVMVGLLVQRFVNPRPPAAERYERLLANLSEDPSPGG